jgi:hypothetical protein
MLSVHQPWDPLRACAVGKSYPPEFYEFIKNSRLRDLFQQIAKETEEDFQNIIRTLTSFGVDVIRPNVPSMLDESVITSHKRVPAPISMVPRDQMIMIGDKFFFFPYTDITLKASGRNVALSSWSPELYKQWQGKDWPTEFTDYEDLPTWAQAECRDLHGYQHRSGEYKDEIISQSSQMNWWEPIKSYVRSMGNTIIENQYYDILNRIPANGVTRIGRDLYFGYTGIDPDSALLKEFCNKFLSEYRCHWVLTEGHIDGCFSPVKPGLIVSILDIKNYAKTFPNWEVVYLENESWSKVSAFLKLKEKNQGRWWIKDYEHDNELIDFVETWLRDWTGYVEESVFDVNMLTIDEHNVIVNSYNKTVFDAFKKHNITAHICPMRHRYFWDGGVHCVTLDLHRQGTLQDFFPERHR